MNISQPLFRGKTRPTNPDLVDLKQGDALKFIKTTGDTKNPVELKVEITDVFLKEITGHHSEVLNGVKVPSHVAQKDDHVDKVTVTDKKGQEKSFLLGTYWDRKKQSSVWIDTLNTNGKPLCSDLAGEKEASSIDLMLGTEPEWAEFQSLFPGSVQVKTSFSDGTDAEQSETDLQDSLKNLFGDVSFDEILNIIKGGGNGLPVSLDDLKTFLGDLSKGKLSLPLDKTFAIMTFLNEKGVDPAKLLDLMSKVQPLLDKAKDAAKELNQKDSGIKGAGSVLDLFKNLGAGQILEDAKKAIESSRSSLPEPLQGLVDKLLEKLESGHSEDPQDGDSGQR